MLGMRWQNIETTRIKKKKKMDVAKIEALTTRELIPITWINT